MEYLTVKEFKQFIENQRKRGNVFIQFETKENVSVDKIPLVIRTKTKENFSFFNETRSTVESVFIGNALIKTPINNSTSSELVELVVFNIDYSAKTYCTVGDIWEAISNADEDAKIVIEIICSHDENFLDDSYNISLPKSSVDMMIINNKFLVIEKIYPNTNEMKVTED